MVTPSGLAALTATDARRGLVELATSAEVATGTDTDRAVTPAGAAAVYQKKKVILKNITAATYTLVADDAGKRLVLTGASGCVITVPNNVFSGHSDAAGETDQIEFINRIIGGGVSFVGGANVGIESEDSKLKLNKYGSAATLTLVYDKYNGTDSIFHLAGSLKARAAFRLASSYLPLGYRFRQPSFAIVTGRTEGRLLLMKKERQ